ncbi:MAG TPA: translation elongation factor Ts [Candidatus Dormibacteraeota bacterium]|nr:translation elongation factor Ts [Candidatus Dormibacteraeota bacterium]
MSSPTTYKPSAEEVKTLREATEAGMIECRNALVEVGGDFEKAKAKLAASGAEKLAKKAERTANQGLVEAYVHAGGKIGSLVEINCETDFVARGEKFVALARDVAMQVVAMNPLYVDRSAIPADVVAAKKAEFEAQVPAGKPPEVKEKIITGKLEKWYGDVCLVDQAFVKSDSGQTVAELIGGVAGVLGENIRVKRFARFALGE